MKSNPCPVYSFLRAARGNWRNAIAIVCQTCPYSETPICAGHLMAVDALGTPVILPIEALNAVAGGSVDITECAGILDRYAFEGAYGLYLQWQTDSSVDCPIKQLCDDFDITGCVLS